jgi:hypothetical protein
VTEKQCLLRAGGRKGKFTRSDPWVQKTVLGLGNGDGDGELCVRSSRERREKRNGDRGTRGEGPFYEERTRERKDVSWVGFVLRLLNLPLIYHQSSKVKSSILAWPPAWLCNNTTMNVVPKQLYSKSLNHYDSV